LLVPERRQIVGHHHRCIPADEVKACVCEPIHHRERRAGVKNRAPQEIEDAIVALEVEQPAFGQVRIANELRKRELAVSLVGVRCVWLRHDLETMNKQLKASRGRR
jgi:hypothetical protein